MWLNDLTLMVPDTARSAISLASYIGGALIMAYVLIDMRRLMNESRQKRIEDSLFMWLCNVILLRLILILTVPLSGLLHRVMISTDVLKVLHYVLLAACNLLAFIIPLSWLIFIDYFVNRSVARIKKKYKYAFIPFLILAVLYVAKDALFRMESDDVQSFAMGGKIPFSFHLQDIYNIASFALGFSFILYAYMIVRTFHREMKQPLFMRLDIFVVPWLLGIILTVTTGFNLDLLFNSIAVLLIFNSIKNRHRFLDSETLFYNEKFIPFFEKYAQEKKLTGGCAIYFTCDDRDPDLGKILWKCRIAKSIFISMEKGGFMMIADVKDKKAIRLCGLMIQDAANELSEKFGVRTRHWIRKEEETAAEFAARVISEC